MNKLPKKVYLRPRKIIDGMALVEFKANELSFYEESELELVNCIEYVRKDVAEQMAKEFADYCLTQHCDHLLGYDERKTTDDLFTEFINSQKAQKK